MTTLSEIRIHPLKSGYHISLYESLVFKSGLENDRVFAVVDRKGSVITAREYPKLLQFRVIVEKQKFLFGEDKIVFDNIGNTNNFGWYELFDEQVKACKLNDAFSQLMSDFLEIKCHVIQLKQSSRGIKAKYNNLTPNSVLNLSDVSPVHLISESSLNKLNSKLSNANKVAVSNFRPNLVISGKVPFEEETWKTIQIGEVVFEVHCQTKRCNVTLLDTNSLIKNKFSEPLKTLRTFQKSNQKGVCFGIYLIPITKGKLKIGDSVQVIA